MSIASPTLETSGQKGKWVGVGSRGHSRPRSQQRGMLIQMREGESSAKGKLHQMELTNGKKIFKTIAIGKTD